MSPDTTERDFTLVISQYEKSVTIYYTLRAYGLGPFSLDKIHDPFRNTKKVFPLHYILKLNLCGHLKMDVCSIFYPQLHEK